MPTITIVAQNLPPPQHTKPMTQNQLLPPQHNKPRAKNHLAQPHIFLREFELEDAYRSNDDKFHRRGRCEI